MRLTVDQLATPNRCDGLGVLGVFLICLHSLMGEITWAQPSTQLSPRSAGRSSIPTSIHPYRTPQAIDSASHLTSPYRGSPTVIPVLDWLREISLQYEVAIWLDRSIPSDQEIAIPLRDDRTLLAAIDEVANQLHAGVAIYDHVIAIVPRENSESIEVAYWKLFRASSLPLVRRADGGEFGWEDGTRFTQVWNSFRQKFPRLLADSDRSGSNGIVSKDRQQDTAEIRTDRLEDIWRASRFQNTSPAAIAFCLLSGFDRVLQADAEGTEGFQIVPLRMHSASSDVEWDYRDEIEKVGRDRWKEWRERWPNIEVSRRDESSPTTWRIVAPPRAHWELVAYLAPKWEPKKPKSVDRSLKRYTGTYRGEFQRILEGFATQSSLRLSLPKLPPQLARKEIEIQFEQASMDEIIAKLSEASGIRIRRKDDELVVEFP